MLTLNSDEIQAVLAALQEAEWDHAVVVIDDVSISVSRNGVAAPAIGETVAPTPAPVPAAAAGPIVSTPAPASVPPPVAAPEPALAVTDASESEHRVTAPSVGVFWSAPEPGAPPFVTVGQRVEAGDTLCIVEVMKLMNNVTTSVSGTVTRAFVENGHSVEFDAPLFTIREN